MRSQSLARDPAAAVSRRSWAWPAIRTTALFTLPCTLLFGSVSPAALAQGRPAASADNRTPSRLPPSPAVRPDPADPAVPVPLAVHRSALAGTSAPPVDAPTPWRSANETVNRIGGWRAYAREAAAPPASPGADDSRSPSRPAASPAHRHHDHEGQPQGPRHGHHGHQGQPGHGGHRP
jgi:hypothetical protein